MNEGIQQLGQLAKIAAGILANQRAFCGPLWVQIGISNRCNYRCVMCWDHPSFVPKNDPYPDPLISKFYRENPTVDRSTTLMDMNLFQELVNDLHAMGTRRVDIVGRGEPFLNKHIARMITFLKQKKMYCNISTNGSMLDKDSLTFLITEGVDHLVVSLNAGRPETYGKIHATEDASSFFKVRESLVQLNRLKTKLSTDTPFLTLSFVLSKPNCEEAGEMLELAREVGAKQVIFKHAVLYPGISFLDMPASQKVLLDKELFALEKEAARIGIDIKLDPPMGSFVDGPEGPPSPLEIYSRIPCYIGWLFALITADGTVLPCCHCFSAMGNVKDRLFRQIWQSPPYMEFRGTAKNLNKTPGTVPNCRCDLCTFTKYNLSLHNYLHPFSNARITKRQREYGLLQVLSSILLRGSTSAPKETASRSRYWRGNRR